VKLTAGRLIEYNKLMTLNMILSNVVERLGAIKPGGGKGDPKLAALDRGVLTVALMLAAIDGTVLPDEYQAFESLAKKCRGATAKNVRELVDKALYEAGYLMAMAQVGIYSKEERLAAFVRRAEKALPSGFADGSPVDVRRAFVLWTTMGVSDGTFSSVERAALEALLARYADDRHAHEVARAERVAMYLPLGREDLNRVLDVKRVPLLEPHFLGKAERLVRDMAVPAKRASALRALDALISG